MLKTTPLQNRITTILLIVLLLLINLNRVIFADVNQLLFHIESFKDLGSLAVKLQDTREVFSKSLASQFSAKTQQLLMEYDGENTPSPALQQGILMDLNKLLQESVLYNEQHFTSIPLSKYTQQLLSQNPKSGENLIRLNRFLLADAYPQELVSPLEQLVVEHSKEIETCKENLRRIKRALENYRVNVKSVPQWLSELSQEHLSKKDLLCPVDPTVGNPGVLTEGATDPTLPCSYLYTFRPSQQAMQNFLLENEGDMVPIVRCQHHFLNLSVGGKLYRNGPQRAIYNSNPGVKIIEKPNRKILHIRSPEDLEAARALLGDEFFETQDGKDLLKNITRQPAASSDSKELNSDDPPQPITKRSSQKTFHVRSAEDLAALREQLGDEFFETQEGKDLLKHLATLPSGSEKVETQISMGTSMPDFVFTNRSGETVKLEQFHDKFILLNLFSVDCVSCGPDLQHLEKQLENADLSQLQIVGIILGDPAEALAGFEKKYQLSMPLWIDKKSVILNFLNSDTVQPQTKLITILLNPEMVVEEIFTDKPTLSQKVKTLIKPKE